MANSDQNLRNNSYNTKRSGDAAIHSGLALLGFMPSVMALALRSKTVATGLSLVVGLGAFAHRYEQNKSLGSDKLLGFSGR